MADPVADAQAVLRSGQQVDVSTLLTATNLSPADIQAQANQYVGQLSSDVYARWQQATSSQANDQRVSAGTAAAADLVSNGYNPDSAQDNQKLVYAVAGAVSLVPVVGPFLGGAVVLLDQIALAIGKFLEDIGLIWYGCRTSGNWTPKMILSVAQGQAQNVTVNGAPQGLPPTPAGSFAALVLPMLAKNAADIANCKGGLHNAQVIAAAATMWNANSSGPAMTVYVPALSDDGSSNVFPSNDQIPYAFQPASDANQFPGVTYNSGWPGTGGAFQSLSTPAFILKLNGSNFSPATKTTAAKKAATVAIAAPATIALGTLIYATIAGRSVNAVLDGLWRTARGFFGKVAGEAEHLTENPIGLFERQSTTVQSLLFPRDRFDARSAKRWAKREGYRSGKTHTTDQYIRVRQRAPADFKRNSFRTINFGSGGIKAVIGHLRED